MPTEYEPVRESEELETIFPASPIQESNLHTRSDEVESSSRTNPTINRQLYVSHFLSTWNVRGFEFGAVLFLAVIFPGTLLPMSVYTLIRAASAIVLSPIVGRHIDNGDRLQVIQVSIGKSFRSRLKWPWEE